MNKSQVQIRKKANDQIQRKSSSNLNLQDEATCCIDQIISMVGSDDTIEQNHGIISLKRMLISNDHIELNDILANALVTNLRRVPLSYVKRQSVQILFMFSHKSYEGWVQMVNSGLVAAFQDVLTQKQFPQIKKMLQMMQTFISISSEYWIIFSNSEIVEKAITLLRTTDNSKITSNCLKLLSDFCNNIFKLSSKKIDLILTYFCEHLDFLKMSDQALAKKITQNIANFDPTCQAIIESMLRNNSLYAYIFRCFNSGDSLDGGLLHILQASCQHQHSFISFIVHNKILEVFQRSLKKARYGVIRLKILKIIGLIASSLQENVGEFIVSSLSASLIGFLKTEKQDLCVEILSIFANMAKHGNALIVYTFYKQQRLVKQIVNSLIKDSLMESDRIIKLLNCLFVVLQQGEIMKENNENSIANQLKEGNFNECLNKLQSVPNEAIQEFISRIILTTSNLESIPS